MPAGQPAAMTLYEGFVRCHMSYAQLQIEQFALGGDLGLDELEATVLGMLTVEDLGHNVIAHALNEHLIDQGQQGDVGYRGF